MWLSGDQTELGKFAMGLSVTKRTEATHQLVQDKVARITGGFYVAYILASVLANALGHIGLGTAQQVSQSILTNEGSFRLGLVIALITGFLFLVTAWGLYVLPVSYTHLRAHETDSYLVC